MSVEHSVMKTDGEHYFQIYLIFLKLDKNSNGRC